MRWHPEDDSDGSKHCVQCVSYTVMTPNVTLSRALQRVGCSDLLGVLTLEFIRHPPT